MPKLLLGCLFQVLLFCFSGPAGAGVLKGKVTDQHGTGLPFASVYVKNSNQGTTTNEQGNYQLTLDSGTYEMVFQYIGYKVEIRQITMGQAPVMLNVTMEPEAYNLGEVTVRATDKDPAYEIIKNAIRKRKYHLNEAKAYSCQVYIKGLGRLTEVPNKMFGIKVNDVEPGIVYLSESVSELHFQQPNKIRERMISSKVSGNSKGFSFNRAARVNFSFYENLLKAPGLSERGFVSPIAGNAMLFYRYELIGTNPEGNIKVHKIKVTPIRKTDPVFSGYIYIVDGSWRLHSLSLYLTEKNQIEYVDTVRIRQIYAPVKDDVWMMMSQRVNFNFASFGFKGNGYFTTVYSRYKVQPAYARPMPEPEKQPHVIAQKDQEQPPVIPKTNRKNKPEKPKKNKGEDLHPKGFFTAEIMTVEAGSNKRDSAYWETVRPVPLTLEEEQDYVKNDSLQVIHESRPYLDSIDQKANKFQIGHLWSSGYEHRNSYKKRSVSLNPVFNVFDSNSMLQYNTVEGAVLDAEVTYRQDFEDNRYYEISPVLRYGFADEKLKSRLKASYYYNPKKYARIQAEGGRYVFQFNPNNPISTLLNSAYTLLGERNYLKIYQKDYMQIQHHAEILNGLRLTSTVEYASRTSLENHTDYTFRESDSKKITSNVPFSEEGPNEPFARHQALLGSVTIQYRPGQKYISRPDSKWALRSKYPTFTVAYFAGVPVLGADVTYGRLAGGINDEVELGLFGTFRYTVGAGTFVNRRQMYFPDYKHFMGNQTFFGGNFSGFQLLPYYQYSTNRHYLEAHVQHEFNGFFVHKIPLLRKTKIQEVASLRYLRTPESRNYMELGIGAEHIFKLLRVDFVTTLQSKQKVSTGIRVGFGF